MLRFCAVDVAVSGMLPATPPLPAPRLDPVAASPPSADVVTLVLSDLPSPAHASVAFVVVAAAPLPAASPARWSPPPPEPGLSAA